MRVIKKYLFSMMAVLFMSLFVVELHAATFRGVILDGSTDEAIAGVSVSLEDEDGNILRRAETDGEGAFTLAVDITLGMTLSLALDAPGYSERRLFYAGTDLDPSTPLAVNAEVTFFTEGDLRISMEPSKVLQEQIVRSGARLSQRERESLTTTTLSEDDVTAIRIRDARDLSGVSANLLSLNSESALGSFFSLRGITSINTFDPLVVIYIDDVAQFQSQDVPLSFANIESLRILKGPQLTLYGRNSMAGVIDIQTRKPKKPYEVALSLEGQFPLALRLTDTFVDPALFSFDEPLQVSGALPPVWSADVSIALPFVYSGSQLRISSKVTGSDGIITNTNLDKYTGGAFSWEVATEFFLPITPNISLTLVGEGGQSDNEIYPYAQTIDAAYDDPFVINHDTDSFAKRTTGDGAAKLLIQQPYFDITSVTTYHYFNNSLTLDTDFSEQPIGIAEAALKQNVFTQEFRISSTSLSEQYFSWLVGAYFYLRDQDFGTEFDLIPLATINPASIINGTELATGTAFFTSLVFPFVEERYALILGARLDLETREHNSLHQTFQDANRPEISGDNPDNFHRDENFFEAYGSGKASFSSQLTSDLLHFISFATGFRSGGVNLLTTQDDRLLYEDEYSFHSETGIKGDYGFLNFQVSLFHIYWLDQQITMAFPDSPGVFEFGITNIGEPSQNYGVEIEQSIWLPLGFGVDGNFGYTETDFGLYTPRFTTTAGLKHVYAGKSERFRTLNRIEYKYFSRVYYDLAQTESLSQAPYGLLNFSTSYYIGESFLISLWGKNLLDTRYLAFVLPFGQLPAVEGGAELEAAKLGDPLTLGVKISYLF